MPTTSDPRLAAHRRAGRFVRPLAAVALLALAVPACASGGDPDLAAGPATELAAGAEALAGFLDAEAACEAIEQAEALLVRARDGQAAGEVPDDVVARVERVTTRVTDEVACEPEPEPEPEPAPEDQGNGDEGKDEGKGNQGRGNEGKGRGGGNRGKG